ncbi:6985_t:CDS:2 [Paraglomus brasilianum]|uniref:6985_t:CDS:1 n=1 Tax=Paraglomus brasilianum TaxID=144538 RepID=A0A9N9DYN0_9GLOM|nr:6985_t:CDS:2 [Paraglomus brasilianum]
MNDQTTVAQYLQTFVAGKASSEQATAVTEIFTQNWLNTLGDVKNFTATELRNLNIPAENKDNEYPSKRPRIGIVPERTKALCEVLIQPFDTLPTSANELPDFIDMPLCSKLPVALYSELTKFNEISEGIYYDEINSESLLARTISNALSEVELTAITTKLEMVTSVDILTKRPLQLFCNNSGFRIDFARNATERGTTTDVKSTPATKKQMRPDLLGYINDLLVIKNEEKPMRALFSTARYELLSKFSKLDPLCFGPVKFLICYVVAKDIICFYAIDGNKMLVPLSSNLYMEQLDSRFKVLKIIVNIARIFKTMITNNAFPDDIFPIGKPLELGHSTITFFDDYVHKVVLENNIFNLDENRVDTLRHMYEIARGHNGLVQVFEGPFYKKRQGTPGKYVIKLQTRGYKRVPKDEPTTWAMTRSLLTGLNWLHQSGYVHRDICLPNIVYDPTGPMGYEYVLIDFEHGGHTDEIFNTLLTQWDLGTLDQTKAYTTLSEMYQLGKLLEGLNTVSSKDGRNFIRKLKGKHMEADMALLHQWITQ